MQEHLGIMEKEAELGRAKAHHEKIGVVPGDKTASEVDESGFRACDKNVSGCDLMTAKWAGSIVACARAEAIRVIGMKSMTSDKLETCGLKITGASNKAPQSEVWEGVSHRMGKNRIGWVRL